MKYALVCDWETTGLPDRSNVNYLKGPQGIQIGAIVVETDGWKELDRFSETIKYEGSHPDYPHDGEFPNLTWSVEAEKIHGLSPEVLREIGRSYETVASDFDWFLRQFWREDDKIIVVAQNPSFDVYFTSQLMHLAGRAGSFNPHHRMIDTFTLGKVLLNKDNSKELFEYFGFLQDGNHVAIADAEAALTVVRECRRMVGL